MSSERIEQVRATLAEFGTDALVLSSPANRRWATGFTSAPGVPFSTDLAIITPSAVELLVAPIHVGWARGESDVATDVRAHKGQFATSFASYLNERGFTSIALEADALPYPDVLKIQDAISTVEIDFVTGLRDKWRASKDPREIVSLERAARITDDVFVEISNQIAPGMSEASIARRISAQLIERSDGLAFDVIVASGPNAARPHHRPGNREIQANEPIIIDMGGRVDGYCGDLTRTLWLGDPDQRFREMYQAVLAAQQATRNVMTAGTPVRDLAAAADRSLQESGFGEYILHSVGHGVGLEIHESPAIRPDLDAVLPLNAVVTVEPGVYVPDWGGIRVEDVVVVGESDNKTLTTAPKLQFD
jgi:Xaa-Pro aminopeptidase